MAQYIMLRMLTFYVSGVFLSLCVYFFFTKYYEYVNTINNITHSTLIILLVEVCFVSTLLACSILLMMGSIFKCVKSNQPWLIVLACGIVYYCIATPLIKHEMIEYHYIIGACASWYSIYLYYNMLKLDKHSKVLIPLSESGPPLNDEIHEMIITNDLPPAYDTLKNFEEISPPSYVSAITDNPDSFMAVSY